MLNVHHYLSIRIAHQKNESKRSIARRLHHSQSTVATAIASETGIPDGYKRSKPPQHPKLGAFIARIDAILLADESAPPKQRHTAMQLFRRLVSDDGYRGKYDQVRRYVKKHARDRRQTLVPLDHSPGERIECDFGQISVDYPDGRRVKDVLIVTWSFSHAVFMIATPNQRTESVLHGMTTAFAFFECVATEVWWDNPKTIATTVLRGRDRVLNDDYAALASHYRFDPRACMPAKGQEKPDVESGVKALQRRACTPVPQVRDDDELNAHLLTFCQNEMTRKVSGQTQTIGERFALDKQHAIELPKHGFDPCISKSVLVDKYQTATFEHNRYSVPKWAAFLTVVVKGYVDRVEIIQSDKTIATHRRSYENHRWIVEPLHYVAALSVRPHALDHSNVFRDWKLPGIFSDLRHRLEREHGANAGIRQYIRVLQMLPLHPSERIAEAIKRLWHREHLRGDLILAKAEAIAMSSESAWEKAARPPARESEAVWALRGGSVPDAGEALNPGAHVEKAVIPGAVENGATTGADGARSGASSGAGNDNPRCHPIVHVPRPDLRRFNQLLSFYPGSYEGDSTDERNDTQPHPSTAVEAQSQGVETAHDVGRA